MLSCHKKGPCFLSGGAPHLLSGWEMSSSPWGLWAPQRAGLPGQDGYCNLWVPWPQQLFSQPHTECHPCLLDTTTSPPPVTATDRACWWDPTGPSRTDHLEGYYKSHMAKHAFHNASVKTLSDSSENLNLALLKTQKTAVCAPLGKKKKDCNYLLLIFPLERSHVFKNLVDFWILQEPEDVLGTIFIFLTALGLLRSHMFQSAFTQVPSQSSINQIRPHCSNTHTLRGNTKKCLINNSSIIN